MYEQNTKNTMTVKHLVCLTHRFDQDESQAKFWIMFVSYITRLLKLCCIHAVSSFIIYMTKLLQSDWLRGVQLFH
jgi:hypothetical protein